jgi:hypothetical protein
MNNKNEAQNAKLPQHLKKINSFLSFIDSIIGKFGIFYKIIFILAIPTLAMYFPLKFIASEIIATYSLKNLYANPYVLSLTFTGVFFIILYFAPKVATVLEYILSIFYVLFKGFGVSDFIFYQFTVESYGFKKFGVLLCSALLVGKTFFLFYKILKKYRRKHMTKLYDKGDYFSEQFYNTDNIVVGDDNSEESKLAIDNNGFITDKVNSDKNESFLPDLTGFIIDDEENEN